MKFLKYFVFSITVLLSNIYSQSIVFHTNDATVWSQQQQINGELDNFYNNVGTLYLNGNTIPFNISNIDSSFSVDIIVSEGSNEIYVEVQNDMGLQVSDTLIYILGYKLTPDVFAFATVDGRDITLRATLLENPDSASLEFEWKVDDSNPQDIAISNATDTVAFTVMPQDAQMGEYYFNLFIYSSDGDTVKARTFVTNNTDSLYTFKIKSDYASWIDSAIIYEITPYNFVIRGGFNDIRNKIPDLVRLGINTIWIQPIYKTYYGGQGYDVINYFEVREDYGTEEDLRNLILDAKEEGLKVLFDIVPNHTSIKHPYAQNTIMYGEASHYYDFYQREFDNAPYSMHYNLHSLGFIYYFWTDLVNLNFNNLEVQKWITEAITYWVREYDIDGYRFDAVWGVNARNPEFMKQVRLALKRIKPEILMLAEDKATWPETFDENFDVAFDWYPEESWVSHWVWQTNYSPSSNATIFNYSNQNQRSQLLRNALTNHGSGYSDNAKILRFIGNNDIFHFITHHGVERTKMVAALEFSLHGVPLIYNGQEIGIEGHPYGTEFVFFPGLPIDYDDPYNLFPFYKNLIYWRKNLPALYSGNYEEIPVSPSQYVFSFKRSKDEQHVITVLNMGGSSVNVTVTLPVDNMNLDSSKTYYLTNLLAGDVIFGTPRDLEVVSFSVDKFSAKVYLLADSIVTTNVNQTAEIELPSTFKISQNYPNPFNSGTVINYFLPTEEHITIKLHDILGNEITKLVDEIKQPGSYRLYFDGKELASGIYFYTAAYNNQSITRKLLLLK